MYKPAFGWLQGINTSGESTKVIREANNLFEGRGLSAPGYYLYFTEIFLVYIKLKTGAGYTMVIALQMLINLASLIALYRFLIVFYRSVNVACVACLLLLLCFPYQLYNTFLYTESIFFSLSLIYSCWLLTQKSFTLKRICTAALFVLLLCVTRPAGIFFAAATFVYILFFISTSLHPLLKRAVLASAVIAGFLLLNRLIIVAGTLDMMLPFRTEMVICDVQTHNADINVAGNGNSLPGMLYYITHNFSQFSRLGFEKTKSFFGLTRSFYSKGHNLFVAGFFYSFYLLIILTIARYRKSLPRAFAYIAMLVGAFWFTVLLSCDEWHSRFF